MIYRERDIEREGERKTETDSEQREIKKERER